MSKIIRIIELEDVISHIYDAGEFRFDIKWTAENRNGERIYIFVDTKNYSRASNMFKDLGQFKAYLREIDSFDQLRIIQQGDRGVTREQIIKRLQKELQKSTNMRDVFQIIWDNTALRKNTFGELRFQEAFEFFSQGIQSGKHPLYETIQTTIK